MARSTPALLTPEVLRWARVSAGYTAAEAAREIGVYTWQVEAAESGHLDLSLREAEKAARLYDRPLATLFLPEPPFEESQEALFRRLPGAPTPPWPPQMRKLARRVRNRQDAAVELYDLLEESPPWVDVAPRFDVSDTRVLASRARALLGISLEEQQSWNDPVGYMPLRGWVDAVEALGVLVMQDGSLRVDEMRGFASLHETVPAIVLNTKDDARARAFTVVHELGHILRPTARETWCNEFAGEVLVPTAALREQFELVADRPYRGIFELARSFGVTPYAAAVRISRARLLSGDDADSLIAFVRSRERPPRRSGGNFYRNKITWLGPAFVRLVLDAADGQAVTLSNAAGLLEAKVDHFATLRQRVQERAEFG